MRIKDSVKRVAVLVLEFFVLIIIQRWKLNFDSTRHWESILTKCNQKPAELVIVQKVSHSLDKWTSVFFQPCHINLLLFIYLCIPMRIKDSVKRVAVLVLEFFVLIIIQRWKLNFDSTRHWESILTKCNQKPAELVIVQKVSHSLDKWTSVFFQPCHINLLLFILEF